MSSNVTLSLYRYSGYSSLSAGSHTLQVVATGEGQMDSPKSSVITFTKTNMPAKGQKISLNLDGTSRYYRVVKVSGNNAEVVALFDATTSAFGSSQTYANSALDTYLNTTWYATLTSDAKAAIVDKTFTQDSWYWGDTGNPDYSGYYGTTNPGTTAYTVSLGNSAFGVSITRHVYALSVQDVIDYVKDTSFGRDGALQNYNIWKMFWDDEVTHSGSYLWLRSAYASSTSNAWIVNGDYGRVSDRGISSTNVVRPALTVDLSLLSWS